MKPGQRQPASPPGPVPGLLEVAPWVLRDDCGLPPLLRSCLLALSSFGGPNSRGIFPSVATLAGRYGCKERSARSHLRRLEKGEIVSTKPHPGGRQGTNLYVIHLDALRRLCEPSSTSQEPACADAEALLESEESASRDTIPLRSVQGPAAGKPLDPGAADAKGVRKGKQTTRSKQTPQIVLELQTSEPQAPALLDPGPWAPELRAPEPQALELLDIELLDIEPQAPNPLDASAVQAKSLDAAVQAELLDLDTVQAELLGAVFAPDECLWDAWMALLASDAQAARAAGRQMLPGSAGPTVATRQMLPCAVPTTRQMLPVCPDADAAEPLHSICSMEPEKTGEREARPPAWKESLEQVEQPAAVTPAKSTLQLAPREVASLWSTAWAARHRASYTPDRQDQDRYRWLAQLATDRAHERAEAVRTAGLPVPGPMELMRQYLTLLFAAFLADPGRSTGRDGEKYLVSVRHPLRCLEQDVGRLRVLWPALPVAASAEAAGMAPGGPGEGRGPGLVSTRRPQLAAGSEPMPARPQKPPSEAAAQLRALGLFRAEGSRGRKVGSSVEQPRERGVA